MDKSPDPGQDGSQGREIRRRSVDGESLTSVQQTSGITR